MAGNVFSDPLRCLQIPWLTSHGSFFLYPPKISGDPYFFYEMFNDDAIEFQGQFNRAESISKLIFVIASPCGTVWLVKVETFGQSLPQNDLILAYKESSSKTDR